MTDAACGGTVMRYEGEKLMVLFDTVGYKALALDLVQEEGLLQAAKGERRRTMEMTNDERR